MSREAQLAALDEAMEALAAAARWIMSLEDADPTIPLTLAFRLGRVAGEASRQRARLRRLRARLQSLESV
jgi:hypothetical protein